MSEKEYQPSEADRDNKLNGTARAEHERLCRQLNQRTWESGFHAGSASRLRKAIEGAIWLMRSMPQSTNNTPTSILYAVERRLTEAMALDEKIREQEGLVPKDEKAVE